MASTRNINTPGDYKQQQDVFSRNLDINLYKYGSNGMAYNPGLPNGGSAPPSKMWRDSLSSNPIEIESALFGINSTNLVNPQNPVKPNLINLPNVAYFDRMTCIVPKPLEIAKDQRPYPI